MKLNKLRDRGTKKWTAIMLPEHVKALKDWSAKDDYVEMPDLDEFELTLIADEFELTLIADEIERAYKGKMTVKLTYWREGKLLVDYGVPIDINTSSKAIVIDDPFGTSRYKFNEIVGASLVE